MARAIYELKSKYSTGGVLPPEIEETVFPFLDRFYTSRIGIRTLIGACPSGCFVVWAVGLHQLMVAVFLLGGSTTHGAPKPKKGLCWHH